MKLTEPQLYALAYYYRQALPLEQRKKERLSNKEPDPRTTWWLIDHEYLERNKGYSRTEPLYKLTAKGVPLGEKLYNERKRVK